MELYCYFNILASPLNNGNYGICTNPYFNILNPDQPSGLELSLYIYTLCVCESIIGILLDRGYVQFV